MSTSSSRIRYQDGQFLPAADLVDDRGYEARLRGLHTRVVHGTWGISLGLEPMARDGRLVVFPGLAHDRHGRELVLSEAVEAPLPVAVADGHQRVLVARYDSGPDRPVADIAAVRMEAGIDPTRDRPALLWRRRDEIEWGEEVPLAVVEASDGVVSIDPSVRPYVRAAQRPYVGFGAARFRGRRPSFTGSENGMLVCVWPFAVDTSEGGFVGVPDYFVALADGWADGAGAAVLGALTAVSNPTSTGFIFHLTGLFAESGGIPHAEPEVAWFGLEDRRGCPAAPPSEQWVMTLAGLVAENVFTLGGLVL